ncbi:MAG: hypothetical protein WCZ18_02935 [Ottowia sp.]|nr:hypothetical protein [Ottowia sp.]
MDTESSGQQGRRSVVVPILAALLAGYQLFLLSRAPEQWLPYSLSFAGLALLVPLSYLVPSAQDRKQHPVASGLYTLAFVLIVVGLVFRLR